MPPAPSGCVRTVPLVVGDAVEAVQCGQLADVAAGVSIAGATALCFNSGGRQVANADPDIGGAGLRARRQRRQQLRR